jgi:hypothetical protein
LRGPRQKQVGLCVSSHADRLLWATKLNDALFRRELNMDWVLFISLQWIVLGSPPPPSTQQIGPFATEELCVRAAEKIRTELNTTIPGQHVQTFARVVCFALKEKEASKDGQVVK